MFDPGQAPSLQSEKVAVSQMTTGSTSTLKVQFYTVDRQTDPWF